MSPLTQSAFQGPKEEGVDIPPSNHSEESSKEEESKNLGGALTRRRFFVSLGRFWFSSSLFKAFTH